MRLARLFFFCAIAIGTLALSPVTAGRAEAQVAKQPVVVQVNYSDPVVRDLFNTEAQYMAFLRQVAKLAVARRISVIITTVPDLRGGESIARLFAEANSKAINEMKRADSSYENERVLVLALSRDPRLFAIYPSDAIADLLTVRGTNYSDALRRLQVMMQKDPARSLAALLPILENDLRPLPAYLNYLDSLPDAKLSEFLDDRGEMVGAGKLIEELNSHVFSLVQFVVVEFERRGFSDWWLLAIFLAAIYAIKKIVGWLIAKLKPKNLDPLQEQAFDNGFDLIAEKAFALGLVKLFITAAFGDLISILKLSQVAHFEFIQIWKLMEFGTNLTTNLPGVVRAGVAIMAIAGFAIIPAVYLFHVLPEGVRQLQDGELLYGIAALVSAGLQAYVVFGILVVVPSLFALEGAFGTVVISVIGVWSLIHIRRFAAALRNRRTQLQQPPAPQQVR